MTSATFETATDLEEAPRRRSDPVLIGLWISLVLVALIWIAPFIFMIFTSLKTNEAVMATGAELIGTLVYHALGSHVEDVYAIRVDPARIKIAEKAKDFSAKFPTITVSKNT